MRQVIGRLSGMLNQPEKLNGLDLHMLAHLQIVMRLKDPEAFSELMEAV
jgi:hypothetical protein